MALAGEAAVRIVPSLKGFHGEVKRKLEAKRVDYDVTVSADVSKFHRQMMQARAAQQAMPVTIPVRTDWNGLKKDLSQVEHIFQRNNLVKGIRFNIKVLGLDALPAMAYAAGSAASGLDALAKSAFIIPGALAGVGSAAAALTIGLSGVGDAFKDYGKSAEDSSKNLKEVRDAQRDLSRAQRDVTGAIRDQRRELEDLNSELRRTALDEAEAILNIQESADRLKQGGFKSISEYQRAQIRYLRDIESLKDVRKNNIRLLEDTNEANAKGIAQGDQVVAALDKVTSAVDRLNEAQKKTSLPDTAFGKVSPNAQKVIEQLYSMEGAWNSLKFAVQDNLFAGIDQSLAQVGGKVLPGLKIGLAQVAGGLNSNIKAALDSVGSDRNAGFWERIFGNTTTGLENFKRGLDPVIAGLSRMAEVGSSFLPRLGTAFESVGRKFDAWTARIAADGTLSQWIDQGLDAVTSLGNIAKNVGSIISSVGEAFNVASGTQGGFIGTFERGTNRLAAYLKGEGRVILTDYFTRAKELITTVGNAFGDMRPFIKDLVDAARNFSEVLLPTIGFLMKMAAWVERNTKLASTLFYTYATYRTLRPIWDGLKGAVENYTKVVGALSNNAAVGQHFQSANNGLTTFKSNLSSMGAVAYGASSKLKPFNGQLSAAATNAAALFAPSNNLTSSFQGLGDKAKYAGQKVGSAGVGASLRGALGGLASFIGPALGAGVLGAALAAGVWGLQKLGEAHGAAEDAARRQKEALSQLKGALDEVTGASTAASLKTAAQIAQQFDMGPAAGGQRNVLDDVQRSKIASTQDLLQATLPQNQQLTDAISQRTTSQAASKIASSEAWTKYKDKWERGGVTPDVLARAAQGDPAALDKVAEAEKQEFGKARRDWNAVDRVDWTDQNRLPSVADVITQSRTFEEAAVGSFLRTTRDQNIQQGDAIKQATIAAGGRASLNPAGKSKFGSVAEVYATPDGVGYLVLSADPGKIDPEVGTVTQLNPNQWQIALTGDATKQFLDIQKFATGGLIGGKGSGTSDSNLLLASRGEFVTRKAAVDHYGAAFFQRLNSMQLPKFDGGGVVPPPVIPWQQQAAQALGAAGYNAFPAQPPPVEGPGAAPGLSVTTPAPGLMTASLGGISFTGAAPPQPAQLAQPPAAPPKPATPPVAPAGVPHSGSGAAPGPAVHSGSGAKPGPVATNPLARVAALSQATGIPAPVLARIMPRSALMGGAAIPYSGLKIGTDIKYGQAGFPDWVYKVAERFDVQASTYAGHQEGSGANKGIDWSGPVENMRALAQYLTSSGIPGLEQVIFQDPRDGAQFGVDPGDRAANQSISDYYRDDWATHMDHVHTRVSAAIPTPEELALMMPGLPAGVDIGMGTGALLPGIMSASGLGGMNMGGGGAGGQKKNGLQNLVDYWTNMEWLQPENVEQFLAGQAQNVGSSLLNIGMGFVQGMTGLDFSSLVGTGQQIGNFVLGTASDGGDDDVNTDVTDLNAMTDEEISRYLNGELSLGTTGGLDGLLGSDLSSLIGMGGLSGLLDETGVGMSYNPGGGAEQWRPVVRRVLEQFGPQYGITNMKAWEDAIVRQIQTESNGDPGADNPNDSNGQGGKQHVSGLLQFLPETFAANNITGGDYLDPVAQIAAAIPYVVNKYGMDANGAPNQIGRGVGYARGGKIRGVGGPRSDANLIRVSRGEFLHNANAVDYYGADFFARLNDRQIPKDSLPGFADGMWWNPFAPAPAPAPAAPAAPPPAAPPPPAPPPQPLAAAGQAAGPLPIAAPAADPVAVTAAPSTGGAPGSGATAPAPDPGALPQVADALAGIGAGIGGMGGGGLAQPGAVGDPNSDQRATLGAAPTSQDHNNPALSAGIQGAFSTIGSLAATAVQAGAAAGSMGISSAASAAGGLGGAGAAQAGQLIQAGAQLAGQVATGAVNILSSLLVGTATNGSTASASGVPLLPQRAPMQTGVPAMGEQYQDNRTYNLTNLDEYKRLQERDAAQATNPWIGKF